MVTVGALCDPEGGLLEEASQPTQPAQPEWNVPTWEDIVRTHSARVYRLAYRLTGNPHDAEDLTQEVFVRVFRSLSSYTPGTFEGWLHRITTNLFLDQARRRRRIRFEGLADDVAQPAAAAPRLSRPGLQRHRPLDNQIQTALKALPPDIAAMVRLCNIDSLSFGEIAATLGVKLGTVRSRISTAAERQAARRPRAPLAGQIWDQTGPAHKETRTRRTNQTQNHAGEAINVSVTGCQLWSTSQDFDGSRTRPRARAPGRPAGSTPRPGRRAAARIADSLTTRRLPRRP